MTKAVGQRRHLDLVIRFMELSETFWRKTNNNESIRTTDLIRKNDSKSIHKAWPSND